MKNEPNGSRVLSIIYKFIHIQAIILIGIFVLFFLLVVVIPVSRAELEFNNKDNGESAYPVEALNDSLRIMIENTEAQHAFLKARLLASKSDSFVLVVNIPDSLVSLHIQGVPVFEAKLSGYKKSRIFEKYSRSVLARWAEYPFEVEHSLSSIPKMPIIYKKAPKDTSEAAEHQKNLAVPVIQEDTWFKMYTDRNFRLMIYPVEKPVGKGRIVRNKFFRNVRSQEKRDLIKSFVKLKIPEYHSNITLFVSASDAKVIYRALPEQALVVIKL